MTIRVWYWQNLRVSAWDYEKDVRIPAKNSTLMVKEDFNVFIITIDYISAFERWLQAEGLKIHWKQPQPAFNYRYPTSEARLVTYVVVKEQ